MKKTPAALLALVLCLAMLTGLMPSAPVALAARTPPPSPTPSPIDICAQAFQSAEPIYAELKQEVNKSSVTDPNADLDVTAVQAQIQDLKGVDSQLNGLLSDLSGLTADLTTSEGKTVAAAREYLTELKSMSAELAELYQYAVDLTNALTPLADMQDDFDDYLDFAMTLSNTVSQAQTLMQQLTPPSYLSLTHGDLIAQLQAYQNFCKDFLNAAQLSDPLRLYACTARLNRISVMFTECSDNLDADITLQADRADHRMNGTIALLRDELSANLSLLQAAMTPKEG